ncbi:hypothetical protein A1O7_08924 [Cladophialophora yegresii CBS 114405]|uniref:IBR domain-containing protein n=1 Tax=Cladophialophora yegresii CBS 114405 TaxID=1182544 RepID=W9VKG7_9EURO|nr:uncharacterized protein A1O7_08924 [Cladophialophora yegresii CBS 114405]EXJ55993.1 hypothetical protein A1O7_08924 [Cladophialophora yegresii CBS 114405]
MFIHNPALADEVSALNAIYGDGVLAASFSSDHHTTLSLKLPSFAFSFLLRVFDDYPQSSPEMIGVDDLVESLKPEAQRAAVYLGACMRAVHCPETVSLFDAIEEFETICRSLDLQCQRSEGVDHVPEAEPANRAEILRDLALRARAKTEVRLAEESHFDIVDCVTEGVVSTFLSREEMTCCGQSIPIKLIRQRCDFKDDFLEAFCLWLQERNAPNPTYCPWEDCLTYIPRRFVRQDYARCPFCDRAMCMLCKKKDHSGVCRQDKKLNALITGSGWKFCPCGQLIEKNLGCNHMRCRCGEEFCYRCGKAYERRMPTCNCGLFG